MIFRRICISLLAPVLLALVSGLMSSAVIAADMSKTLRVVITGGETGLDPATASDVNTLSINENIFDSLLRYDYLARPLKLQPNTVTAMPEVSADGTTYIFHIKPGIHFSSSSVFKGKKRELTAEDYVYSFKRFYDPALKSPWLFLFEDKIVGDEILTQQAQQQKFNYDLPVEGLKALDRYTLRVRLKAPDNNFLFEMAMPATGAVAREVVEAYTDDPGNHPVGTGPYLVTEWQRSNKIVLRANPDFRETIFHATPGKDPVNQAIAAALNGKKLPLVGRIEIKVMEEPQPRMLGLFNREFDYLEQIPPPLMDMALNEGKLKPELAKQGMQLSLFTPLQTYYMWMNMDDPVIGGYAKEKIALRRAIALSYNREEDIRVLEKGLAIPAQSPLPPNVLGYDPAYRSPVEYNPMLARALLDRFGYKERDQDGYRKTPEGKPLTLVMHTLASTTGRLRDELWRKNLNAIGIRVEFKSDKYTEIIKASRLGKVQMFETNWIADFPDAENFFQLLYGPNSGRANYARFNHSEFNQLYEQSRRLADSSERTRLYRDMTQLVHVYSPWVIRTHPLSADVHYSWVKNYKRHPVEFTAWRYIDIDMAARQGMLHVAK
jgi:ABC-type transport system substrate-binding protein